MAVNPVENRRFYTGREPIRVQPGEPIRLRPDFSKVIEHDGGNETVSSHRLHVVGIGYGKLYVHRNPWIIEEWESTHDTPGKKYQDLDGILPAGNIPINGEITETGFVPNVESLPAEIRILFPSLSQTTIAQTNARLTYMDQTFLAPFKDHGTHDDPNSRDEIYIMDWKDWKSTNDKPIYLPQAQAAFDNLALYIDKSAITK